MNDHLEQRLHELRQQAELYAEAKSQRVYLDHWRKAKLAMLMRDFAKQGIDTVNAQEREARCHPDYHVILEALREAVKIEEREGWHLRIAMQGSSLWQTQEATKRAEIKAYQSS